MFLMYEFPCIDSLSYRYVKLSIRMKLILLGSCYVCTTEVCILPGCEWDGWFVSRMTKSAQSGVVNVFRVPRLKSKKNHYRTDKSCPFACQTRKGVKTYSVLSVDLESLNLAWSSLILQVQEKKENRSCVSRTCANIDKRFYFVYIII